MNLRKGRENRCTINKLWGKTVRTKKNGWKKSLICEKAEKNVKFGKIDRKKCWNLKKNHRNFILKKRGKFVLFKGIGGKIISCVK